MEVLVSSVLPWRYYPAKIVINELCSSYWCRRTDCIIKSRNGHHGDVAYKQNFLLLQPLWSLSKCFSAHCGLFLVSYRYISKLCKNDGSPNLLENLNFYLFFFINLSTRFTIILRTYIARALTEENLLFLETWRKIDRAYVDKTFNGQNTAIKKMISTLNNDLFTQFLEPDKMKSLQSGTRGVVTSMGLSIGYPMKLDASPTRLVVISTSLGGPTNKAGILSGILLCIYDAADMIWHEFGILLGSFLLTMYSVCQLKNCFKMNNDDDPVYSLIMFRLLFLLYCLFMIRYLKYVVFNLNSLWFALDKLRAEKVAWRVAEEKFNKLLCLLHKGVKILEWNDGLTGTVLGPSI
ncbi:hypothetical protein UlMin_002968 [Ulmus minor]